MTPLETRYAERFARNDEHNLDIELRAVPAEKQRQAEYDKRTAMAAAHRAEAVRQTAAAQKLRPEGERLVYPPEGEDAW